MNGDYGPGGELPALTLCDSDGSRQLIPYILHNVHDLSSWSQLMSQTMNLKLVASILLVSAASIAAGPPDAMHDTAPREGDGSPQEPASRVTESSSLALSRWATDDPPQEGAADGTAKPEVPQRKQSDDWQFTLSPYLWMLSVRATADVGPLSTTIDKCFSELVKKLDIGGSLRFEGLHGHWGFYVDGTYLGLSDDANARVGPFPIPGVDIEKELTLSWLDFGGIYRLGDDGRSLDFTLGGRYAYIGARVSAGPFLDLDESEDYVEPIVGGRFRYALTDCWRLSISGDVGGFGIGDASDLTWSTTGLVGYQLTAHTTIVIGYRVFDIDRSGDKLTTDLLVHGPMVGFAFQF